MEDFVVKVHEFPKLGDITITEKYEPDYWSDKEEDYTGHYMVHLEDYTVQTVFFDYGTAVMCGIALASGNNFEDSSALARGAARLIGIK